MKSCPASRQDKKYRIVKIYKFILSEQTIVLWEGMSLLAMNSLYNEKGQLPVPMVRRKNIQTFNSLFHSVYLVFSIGLISITDLFPVRYLWDVCSKDKCCVVTRVRRHCRVAWLEIYS